MLPGPAQEYVSPEHIFQEYAYFLVLFDELGGHAKA
jgi:hypothetical protein